MRQPFSGTAERIFMKLLPNDDAEKATLLNKYFSSVFTHDNGVINPTRLPNKSVANISSFMYRL